MAHGTLLGSYFFHDMIPWDDDVDFLVDYKDYPRLKKVFHNQTLWSKYHLHGQKDSTSLLILTNENKNDESTNQEI